MKRFVFILAFISLFLSSSAAAQERGFGIGVILGEPTGFSLKGWTSNNTAVDFGVAWSFVDEGSLHFHADYLVHNFNLFKPKRGKLLFYYGVGGRVKIRDNGDRVGIRVPVGLSYIPEGTSLDIFFEVAPVLDVAPKTEFEFTAGIGIRYYF